MFEMLKENVFLYNKELSFLIENKMLLSFKIHVFDFFHNFRGVVVYD